MLHRPELPVRAERRPLRVAVPVAPDLRPRPLRPTKGLSAGTDPSRPIRTTLPLWVENPALVALAALAERQEERAVDRLHHPAAEVLASAGRIRLAEDHPQASSRPRPSSRATASAVAAPPSRGSA